MTYEETLSFIYGIEKFGWKPGLRRTKELLERMGNPQDRLRFIHVAGTSGKGSICTMLSHILVEAGYKTGLYISPYIIEFRERIQVNNTMISKEDMVECAAYTKSFWDQMVTEGETPTLFEFVVAMTFEYFKRQACDVIVLEVGMGGLKDSTNVIGTPLVSVIGSIGIDHTQYLGETIEEIAFQKCGIIKPGGVTVSYPGQDEKALAVIMERCAEEENKLLIPGNVEVRRMDEKSSDIVWNDVEIHIPLAGEHQIHNTQTVLETIRALELTTVAVSMEDVVRGIATTTVPARFEQIGSDPIVILDGAHNPDKMKALGESLALLGGRRIHAVLAMMKDKDIRLCAGFVLPKCASVTTTTIPNWPRALPPGELAERVEGLCPVVSVAESQKDALEQAIARCQGDDVVLVCGSLYLVGDLRPMALERAQRVVQ